MKIIQVTAVDFTIKKFLLPLIDASDKEGHEIHIACHCGEIASGLRKVGYQIHHIPFSRNLNVISHMMNVVRLVKLFKKEKYDMIHAHTPMASIISRLAARIANVPTIIYTAHGFYFHENMKPLVYKIAFTLEKVWGRLFSDHLFFQSKEDYDIALQHNFNSPDRLLHIGNGVSAERFEPSLYSRSDIRQQYGIKDQGIVLLFVGRLVKEKGILELLDAFTKVKDKHPSVKLMLVGGNVEGDRGSLTVEEIMSLLPDSIRDDVFLLGPRDDIPQLLAASDIFILPSYREGLPRSIIEAMAMAKPIIATDIRGCREEVLPGYNGYLCQAKDSGDLASKIDLLINEPENMQLFGENSREMFLKEFDEKVVVEKQLNIFRMLSKEGV